jgi:SAM-dependent methyltransferase
VTTAVAVQRACCLCGATSCVEKLTVRERMFGLGDPFPYLECAECGSLEIATVPVDLERFYPEGYYSFGAEDMPARGWVKRLLRRLRDRYLLFGEGGALGAWLERRFPYPELRSVGVVAGLREDMRILDVGCGRGLLLAALHARGFRHLTGADPFVPADLEPAPGVRVLKRHVHELQGEWDLVMFQASFEHVPDPALTLRQVAVLLAPGGQVLLRVPVLPNAAFERYGERWVALDAPRHLFVPTRAGMDRLARGAGLRVTRVENDATAFMFWGSEHYVRDLPLASATGEDLFSARQLADWEREARTLNRAGRGDMASFVLAR